MIEALNGTLRRYIERIGWDTIKELDLLIEKFLASYNLSKHKTTKKAPVDLLNMSRSDEKEESKRQKKAGQKRMRGPGFKLAKLSVGDKVRVYDPKRREIKEEQKKQLKGKIKLSDKDYVKQYTSHHMGQDPHWTKTVYKIVRIIKGTRTERYVLENRKGTFLRSELQKVKQNH